MSFHELNICAECGYIDNFDDFVRCVECGSEEVAE